MLSNILFISLLSSIFTHSYSQCLPQQKSLLLQLKNELYFNSSYSTKLVRWNESDECCKWHGVECDAAGHVVSLQLDDEAIEVGIGDSSSLFGLKYLQKLNLAWNDFNSTVAILRGIQNLTYLTHLNLSNAGFFGQVPAEILSLKKLVSLDISISGLSLENPNFEMLLQNLTGLRELYLDGIDITSSYERRKWSHIVSSYLPNLTSLSLSYCGLYGPLAKSFSELHSLSILQLDVNNLSMVVLDSFPNFSSLTILSLYSCDLRGYLPEMIFQIPTLQCLDLSLNRQLSGRIPTLTQQGSLKSINLRRCNFSGSISSTFANLTQLSHADLSHNFFTGSLSSALFEGLHNLAYLSLKSNSFSGNIPHSLFGLPSLLKIHLQNNQFIGQVDEFSIVNVSNIVSLDLSGNQLEGPIPKFFFQLQSLECLRLHENLFTGTFALDKIQSLTNLSVLNLSYNNLSVEVGNANSSTHRPPRWPLELNLPSCNMNAFPHFLKHYDISGLDLSNNRIAGEIPSWIWGKQLRYLNLSFNLFTDLQKPYHIPTSLNYLDLNSNQLRGELHMLIPPTYDNSRDDMFGLQYLLLGNNSFGGSIPTSLCTATSLQVLDLSDNKLSGGIPSCLFDTELYVLDLGQNNISGDIPDNFSEYCMLQYFDIQNNTLAGKIPKSLKRCNLLEFVNVGYNIINDTFPCMLSSLNLFVLVLRSNRFHGEVTCHTSWPSLQIVDISSNNFSGNLESINFSSWTSMVFRSDEQLTRINYVPFIVGQHSDVINLGVSGYYRLVVGLTMKGIELKLPKIWPQFNAIDFSCNNFEGEIPNAIGNLTSLHVLNFSHNAFNGGIPKSFGQLKELESLDLSTNHLSGAVPVELAGLTFLSVLNLSYNKLVGEIPNGRQLQTFSADSFRGNPGLCGFNINISCRPTTDDGSGLSPGEDENEQEKGEIEWEYVFAAVGYVVGLGSVVWILLFCRSFRERYFGKIEEVVEDIFNARDMRRRRARRARAARNRVRRQ